MQVTVIGAAGKTGKLVVEQALAAGYTVTALVRDTGELAPAPGLHVLVGDATELTPVSQAVAGSSAVIDCIGGKTPYKHTELERNVAGTIVAALREPPTAAALPVRLIAISMMGIGDSQAQTPFWYEYLLIPTFLRGSTPDKTAMEAEVRGSGIPYVLVRPPLLTEDAATGSVKVLGEGDTGHKITRADLAKFLVQQVANDTYLGKAVTVANS